MNDAIAAALEQMYGDDGMPDEQFDAIIGQSLHPRGADMRIDNSRHGCAALLHTRVVNLRYTRQQRACPIRLCIL